MAGYSLNAASLPSSRSIHPLHASLPECRVTATPILATLTTTNGRPTCVVNVKITVANAPFSTAHSHRRLLRQACCSATASPLTYRSGECLDLKLARYLLGCCASSNRCFQVIVKRSSYCAGISAFMRGRKRAPCKKRARPHYWRRRHWAPMRRRVVGAANCRDGAAPPSTTRASPKANKNVFIAAVPTIDYPAARM